MKVFLTDLSDISGNSELIHRYEALLSPSDLSRYNQMTHRNRQLQFLAGRALVYENCHEMPTLLQNGKPVVSKGYISLAHSENWVGLAIGEMPVGLDIENTLTDRPFDLIAKRMKFSNSSDRISFYKNFTGFEADYKLAAPNTKTAHFYYSIKTFIICISLLNNKENIEFIKSIPFKQNLPFTPEVFP